MRLYCWTSQGKENTRSREPWEKEHWRFWCEIQGNLSPALLHSEPNPSSEEGLRGISSMQWFVGLWWRHTTPNFIVKGTCPAIDQNIFVSAGTEPELSWYFQKDSVLLSVIWGQNKLSRASDSWFSMIIFMLGLTCLFNPVNLSSKWQLQSTIDHYPQGCIKDPVTWDNKSWLVQN